MQPRKPNESDATPEAQTEEDPFIEHVVVNLYKLGLTWQGDGDFQAAEVVYRLIIELNEMHADIKCAELILGCSNLADILASQNRNVEAEHFYLESINASLRILGIQHPSTAIGLRNYSEFLRGIDLISEADGISQHAQRMFAQSFHRLVATLPCAETDDPIEQAEILLFGFDKQRLWRGRLGAPRDYNAGAS